MLRKIITEESPSIQKELCDMTTARHETLVMSCIISGVPEPSIEWFHDEHRITHTTSYQNRVAKLVIENTNEETAGHYKCIATNVHGQAESMCAVEVREEARIHIQKQYVSQQHGIDSEYEVVAQVTGYPRPKVTWYKSKTKIETKSNTKMSYVDETAILTISKLKRSHTGNYIIEASNEYGECRKELVLTIIDKPGPPEGPLVITTVTKDSVSLSWKAPRDCGGLELSHYTVEKCGHEQNTWIKVADVDKDTLTCIASKLKLNSQCKFRVTASNAIGVSDGLCSETVTIRLQMEVPSPPRGPIEVSGMTMDSFVVSWTSSESDGGSPILEYVVDRKKSTEKEWFVCGATSAQSTHFLIKELCQSTSYDIRIMARNAIGNSLYLQSSEPILTGRLPSKFSEPFITLPGNLMPL